GGLARTNFFLVRRVLVVLIGARTIPTQRTAARIFNLRALPSIGWQEPGVEQLVEALPLFAATAQQRLQTPTQQIGIQYTDALCGAQHLHGVTAANLETIGAQEPGEPGQSRRRPRIQRLCVPAQHAAASRATTARGKAARSSRVLINALSVSMMRSAPST